MAPTVGGPRTLDLSEWSRRDHFAFFSGFEHPYFNICADVDVTRLHAASRKNADLSFFVGALYASARASNEIEEFRYRIRGNAVVVHAAVHPGSTVLMPDETFRFAYFTYRTDFRAFHRDARAELDRVRTGDAPLDPRHDRDDQIHHSVIPWVSFTSFSHARQGSTSDSIPRVVFGRHRDERDRRLMNVSVEVHHALMDGLHVGRWFETFQALLEGAPEFE